MLSLSTRHLLTTFGHSQRFLHIARKSLAMNLSSMATPVPLNFQAGPIVWVDCEMTGLNPKTDKLLEIAVLITNGNLELVDDGLQFVIQAKKSALDNMDEWCKTHHGQSGLTQACLASPHTRDYVSNAVLQYIKRWVPERHTGVLAGNSVHVDRMFLSVEMPEVVDWLHYRIIDVSSIKELCRRWYPNLEYPNFLSGGSHRALDDIRCSIKELTWYRQNVFRNPPLI
ncbi:ribonuclease H-like domain-containing protein [Pisolithus microcarpus]|nr:ribonuclease H-like domain-containing protein [Pisolithus microcarpus]